MKPDTRERLVETARRLFREHGSTATGIAQILDAAGARSGSRYERAFNPHAVLPEMPPTNRV
jgi:hypothetical protein